MTLFGYNIESMFRLGMILRLCSHLHVSVNLFFYYIFLFAECVRVDYEVFLEWNKIMMELGYQETQSEISHTDL